MSDKTRNTLGWWALAACSATTVGAVVTSGTGASTWFAVGSGLLAIVVAALSRRRQCGGKEAGGYCG
ncbi:hypothetical protein ACTVCO_04485 [Sanguibacter sp. A247]|uniref:hypothetical protein n=1 Tax=unclassified Sanguibacter TaxID=2645534 RepID=UPI003FD6E477